jgi:tetratricopeptide (TPR) repeat protein
LTYKLEATGNLPTTIASIEVLLRCRPADREQALRVADLLLRSGEPEAAMAHYAQLADQPDLWGVLAGAHQAQYSGAPEQAIALYEQAIPLTTDEGVAGHIGDAVRDLGKTTLARRAYERAAEVSAAGVPAAIWPVLAEGDLLRADDPAAARRAYEQAQQLAPTSGYPDYALGKLLLQIGDPAGALTHFEAAVDKQPTVRSFRSALAQAGSTTAK